MILKVIYRFFMLFAPLLLVIIYSCNYLYCISGNSKCQYVQLLAMNTFYISNSSPLWLITKLQWSTCKRISVRSGLNFNKGRPGHPRFYNFSIGITFLPYKSTMLSLCGPPDLSAFLHSCMYMLTTNIAHIIPTSSQYSDHCLEVVWVAREYFSGIYCCLLYYYSLHELSPGLLCSNFDLLCFWAVLNKVT